MNGMNIKAKIALTIGVLVSMIVLLVALSVANLQILTATEPDSPAAGPGLNRALIWITVIGGICILIGIGMLIKLPASINSPIKQLADGILEIANHNYDVTLNLKGGEELVEVSKNFNRMARRLNEYHNSTLSDLMASKRYMETIINSINEPIIGLDNEMNILLSIMSTECAEPEAGKRHPEVGSGNSHEQRLAAPSGKRVDRRGWKGEEGAAENLCRQ